MSNQEAFEIAADVISQVGRGERADDILRRQFWGRAGQDRSLRREVSLTVFEYFRWLGLLDSEKPLKSRMQDASELAGSYSSDPLNFGAGQLRKLVPDWLSDQMIITDDWIRSIQGPPPLWVRFRRGGENPMSTLCGALAAPSPSPGFGAFEYRGEEDLFHTPEFRDGVFEIQDLASQWVGHFCNPKPGESWWDVCAGEGGKFLDLADRMENRGSIWVTDRSSWRLKKLKQRAARAKVFNYRSRLADLSLGAPFKVKFDGVLIDAPCSGIGTWQRNPDVRWTTSPDDIAELAELQKVILRNAAPQVKAGGRLVYSVCTLSAKETVEIADWLDAELPGFEPDKLDDIGIGSNSDWPSSESRRWLGGAVGEGNGMFIAAWRRSQ